MAGRRSALLVSTSLYDGQTFRQLQSPAADVAALRDILEDPAIGGYEVGLLEDKASYEVNQAIERFFASASLNDLVLLYFSGHGFKDDGNRLFMVTRDSQPNLLGSTAVSAQFVRDQLERCRSRRKIVILDCCYAGAFPAGATKDTGTVDVLGGFGGRGSVVMTASSALQYAFANSGEEAISEVSEKASPSVFTSALIEGIATGKADLNGDGVIDVDELYNHVHRQVTRKVPQQTPRKHSDVEGTFAVAKSPQGPKPIPLPREITEFLRSPLTKARLGVIQDLVEYCSGASPGTVLAIRNALSELTEDDSNMVAKAARAAIGQVDELAAQLATVDDEMVAAAFPHKDWQSGKASTGSSGQGDSSALDDLVTAAQREADSIRATVQREADELTNTTEREAAKLRATADHEVAEKRTAAEQAIAELRTSTEREVAQLKATAKRERDEILTTSKRQADEMRSQALRILEESEAQRAQSEAEFEIQLAARREEAERQEAERLAAAQSATQKLVTEAEQRASTAEQRAAKASAQADQTRRDADQHARQLVSNAKKNADQIVSQAKTQAEQLLAEVKADSERRRAAAQREVDELTRQKDPIASHLAQVRQLMGGQLPGMDSAASKAENSTSTALAVPAPDSGKHGKRQDDEEDWWVE
jgi:hypothetical protein